MQQQLAQLEAYSQRALGAASKVKSLLGRVGYLNLLFVGMSGYVLSEQIRNNSKKSTYRYSLFYRKPTRSVYEEV